jgi:hypothetical protein
MMDTTKIVLGSKRFKSAIDEDILLNPILEQNQREILEGDRTSTVNMIDLFNTERQKSTTFRFTINVDYLYENNLTGISNYSEFENNLYYVNNTYQSVFSGYPQSHEFDLIRDDTDNTHIPFITKSATTYNWNYYLTYPFRNNNTKTLQYIDTTNNLSWIVSRGILGFIQSGDINGVGVIQITSPIKHGLNEGEYVSLEGINNAEQFTFNNTNIYEVYSIGNNVYDSNEYVFNIINVGYPPSLFTNSAILFKRILNVENPNESVSKYYIREYKVLTNLSGMTLTNNGYQENSFKTDKKYEFSALTPNNVSRISIRNRNKTYNITNNDDLDISGLVDNNGKPITEVSLTFIHKGYMGWFNLPNQLPNPTSLPNITLPSLKGGWSFNLTNSLPNSWWNRDNTLSDTEILTRWYQQNGYTFFYNDELKFGDIIEGEFCEYNDYEQKERIISEYYHKIRFNHNLFNTLTNPNESPGYYYQVHFPIKIKSFSSYIETSEILNTDDVPSYLSYSDELLTDIPSYAFYSNFENKWIWRDIYEYGFIDNDGVGADYPYLNKTHYPYQSIVFRLIPDESNFKGFGDIITQPITDNCE